MELEKKQEKLIAENKKLITDISVLSSSDRIETIAENDLGMRKAETEEIVRVEMRKMNGNDSLLSLEEILEAVNGVHVLGNSPLCIKSVQTDSRLVEKILFLFRSLAKIRTDILIFHRRLKKVQA